MSTKTTRRLTVLIALAALATVAADASAYYHPTIGRFVSRDPGPGSNSTASTKTANFPPRDRSPSVSARPVTAAPAPTTTFLPRDPTGSNQYADGMNLYEYVGSNPVSKRDPSGLYAGITVHRAPKEKEDGQKNVGHEWIEIEGGASYGFYPTTSIWGSDGVVKSPDPHAGERGEGGEDWTVVKMIKLRGVLWGMNYYKMYDPYMDKGWFWDVPRAKAVGCCQDKKEKDVKACIKKWADFWDTNYTYRIPSNTCRHFVRAVLKHCCIRRKWAGEIPSAAITRSED